MKDSELCYQTNVLVLGAKGSIGQEIVKLLIAEGRKVYAHSRHSIDIFEPGVGLNRVEAYGADFSSPRDLQKLVEFTLDENIGTVVCCVGIYPTAIDVDRFEERYEQAVFLSTNNAIGPVAFFDLLCASFTRHRRALHGLVLSSVTTKHLGAHSTLFYTVSKGALEFGLRALAKKYNSEFLRLNILRVGFVNNELHQSNNKNIDERVRLIPLNRALSAQEVAQSVTSLISKTFSFVSGATIDLTGGE